jgi:hypothetical protein
MNSTNGNYTNGDDNDDDNFVDAVSPEDVPYPSSGNNNIDSQHDVEVPKNYFFKGFLAW